MTRGSITLAIGAFVLLFGIYTLSTYGCFGNFAFGGVTCSLWGISPFPDVAGAVISVGLILAGLVMLIVALVISRSASHSAFYPPK